MAGWWWLVVAPLLAALLPCSGGTPAHLGLVGVELKQIRRAELLQVLERIWVADPRPPPRRSSSAGSGRSLPPQPPARGLPSPRLPPRLPASRTTPRLLLAPPGLLCFCSPLAVGSRQPGLAAARGGVRWRGGRARQRRAGAPCRASGRAAAGRVGPSSAPADGELSSMSNRRASGADARCAAPRLRQRAAGGAEASPWRRGLRRSGGPAPDDTSQLRTKCCCPT
ncbi:uncharacterized protein LOC120698204 isoform X2 [Panicum virgatum]|uniref:uncharacterized protein LOC120698204 isoform X2 n=1 Tax=Panicum virgatum TaxID=38727 RepID=UPI0019D54169|nr:uncharacterized protein LOC120698204 isoform X2 [Panicum virgatum]